ncbi:glycerophosphodiester phosphodiesterase family protein [Nocardia callitridis]|uniref:GP-PDE domain-containing protein n=1 Tax=Nocardia callitridis TaxID=648753 RepID=A0ABP9KZA5_9NOCA
MSKITAMWEWMPSWILTALNFGQAYPEGDEDDLWALGEAWKKAGKDLAALEPDIKSVIDRTQKYYSGDGAEAARKEFAKLFHGETSISENAKALEELGEYCRNGGTQVEYTKIMEATFAGITVYAVIALIAAWPWGEAGVPLALAAGRQSLSVAAEQGAKQLMLEAGKVGLKNLLKPYLKQIGIAGLKMGLQGAGIDGLIQAYQMGSGHRDTFDWKQNLRTGVEWGAGGIVGAPVGMVAGRMLGKTALSPFMRGTLTGAIGGVAGGFGMYGAGIGWQAASQFVSTGHVDWGKVDMTFHPQLLAAGVGLGVIHGARSGAHMGNAPRAGMSEGTHASSGVSGGSTKPPVVTRESTREGKQLNRDLMRETHPDPYPPGPERDRAEGFFKRVSEVDARAGGKGEFSTEHVAELQKIRAEWDQRAPLGDGSTSHPDTVGTHENNSGRPTDSAARQADSTSRPVQADRGVSPSEARQSTPQERAPRPAGERAPHGKESGTGVRENGARAAEEGAGVAGDRESNLVAGQKDLPVSSERPVSESGTPESNVPGSPEHAVASVEPEPGAPGRLESDRPPLVTDPPSAQDHTGVVDRAGVPTEQRPTTNGAQTGGAHEEGSTSRPSADRQEPPASTTKAPEPGPREEAPRRSVSPEPHTEGPGTHGDSALTPYGFAGEPGGPRGGDAGLHRGAAGPVGEFHGEARVGEGALPEAVLIAEIRNNLALITPEGVSYHRESGHFVLRDGRTVTVRIGDHRTREVAEFVARPDGTGYDVTVSPGARNHDVARAIAHELAEIDLAQQPTVTIDPVSERPTTLTDHLGGRFAELRALTAHIDRATFDPKMAGELPGLRKDLVDLIDHLGLRAGPQAQHRWDLLVEHDPVLARRLELTANQLAEHRPVFDATLGKDAFEHGRQEHLEQLTEHLTGDNAPAVVRAESLALDGRMREELARRVFDPVFEREAKSARATVDAARELFPALDPINEAMNNPRLTEPQRVAAVHAAIEGFREAMPQAFHDAFGAQRFADMHSAADGLGGPSRSAGVLDHANSQLRVGEETVSFTDFLHGIDRANRGATEHGMNLEYVVVVHAAETGHSMVDVLSRPRPNYRLPLEQNVFGSENEHIPLAPRQPAAEATGGGHTIDVGVGRSAFAVEMTPIADRATGGLIIKTELANEHPIAGQRRRDLGIIDPGPLTERGTVMVFGDLLSDGKVLGDGTNGGVARIFVNNVSAHLDRAGYDAIAAALPDVLAPGGRIEVQWDMKPERAIEDGGAIGDRGHITGTDLVAAIDRRFGADNGMFRVVEEREFGYPGNKDYDYSIDAGSRSEPDHARMATFSPPSPDHRMVIVYEPESHSARPSAQGPTGTEIGENHGGTASKVGDFHGAGRPGDRADLSNTALHEEVSNNRELIMPEGVSWDAVGERFELVDGREVAVRVGPTRDGAVAEFVERPDGSGYDVNVSPRAREQDVTRAVAHEVAEIALAQDPAVLRDSVNDRPAVMTTHLGGRYAELKVLTTQIDRLSADPVRVEELRGLHKDLADLLDRLGVRDGPAARVKEGETDPWLLLAERDPVLAQQVAELGPPARGEALAQARAEHEQQHEGSVVEHAGVDVSDPATANGEIRRWYNEVTGRIPELDRQWAADGVAVDERARMASEIRHSARVGARELMLNQAEVEGLRARDMQVYQNPDGPTFEWLVGKSHTKGFFGDAAYDYILGSSNRTNAEVNQRFANQQEANPPATQPQPAREGHGARNEQAPTTTDRAAAAELSAPQPADTVERGDRRGQRPGAGDTEAARDRAARREGGAVEGTGRRPGSDAPTQQRGTEPEASGGTASKVGDFHGAGRPGDRADLSNTALHEEVSRNLELITPEGVAWDAAGQRFELVDGREVAVRVGATRDGAVAEFVERPDGSGYDVNVAPRAREQDVTRAVAHELAEIALEQDPAVLRDAVNDRPSVMTTHLGGRYAELKVLTAQIDRAILDPARGDELPGLHKDLADLLDRLGVRDGPAARVKEGETDPWLLLAERDPVLAQQVAELGPPARAEALAQARAEHEGVDLTEGAVVHATESAAANVEVRRWYNEVTGRIPELDRQWVAEGRSLEERARLASQVRHGARIGARELMLDRAGVAELNARDQQVYENPDGPTFEWLVGKAHSKGFFGDAAYESIVGSSNRTNAEVNRRFAGSPENAEPAATQAETTHVGRDGQPVGTAEGRGAEPPTHPRATQPRESAGTSGPHVERSTDANATPATGREAESGSQVERSTDPGAAGPADVAAESGRQVERSAADPSTTRPAEVTAESGSQVERSADPSTTHVTEPAAGPPQVERPTREGSDPARENVEAEAQTSAEIVRPPHESELDAAYAENALRQLTPTADPQVLLHPARTAGDVVGPARERANANAAWWHGLDAAHRDAVIQRHPSHVGNADGIPAAARDHANRLALERDLQGFRARRPERLGSGQLVNPEFGKGEPQQLQNMLRTRDALYRAELLADALHPAVARPEVRLLSYGKGRVEIVFGDVDRASSVSMHVVDANAGLRSLPEDVVFARNHFEATMRQSPDATAASVLSYRHGLPGEARVDGYEAARQLRQHLAGLHAGREFHAGLAEGTARAKTHVFAYGPSTKTATDAAAGRRLGREIDTLTLADAPRQVRAADVSRYGIAGDKVTFVEPSGGRSRWGALWERLLPPETPRGGRLVEVEPAPGTRSAGPGRYLSADPATRAPTSSLEVFGAIAADPAAHVSAVRSGQPPAVGDGSTGFRPPSAAPDVTTTAHQDHLGSVLPQDHPITATEQRLTGEAREKLREQFGAHADFLNLVRSVPRSDVIVSSRQRATANARWWHSLTPQHQSAMVRTRPHLIGNTDGVPYAVRDVANRLSIARDLAKFLEHKPADVGLHRWVRTELSQVQRTRLGNLIVARNHLAVIERGANEMIGSPPVQLLSFDAAAYRGNGMVSVSIGNADSAALVTRHIGGFGTTLRSLAYRSQFARSQFEVTSGFAPEHEVAAIIDIGYHHPTQPIEATKTVFAEVGGYVVARDIAAFNATREFQANLRAGAPVPRLRTAIGHSYGSTTLSHAGVEGRLGPRGEGMRGEVDQVVLSGSPGAGPLRDASAFGIGAENVYSLASQRDPIANLGAPVAGGHGRFLNRGLGIDPANEAWGAIRAGAEPPTTPEFRTRMQVHQGYNSFADVETRRPTEALRNIGLIAAGRGAEITHAEHRPALDAPTRWQRIASRPADPEWARVHRDKQSFWVPKVVSERDAAASFAAVEDGAPAPHRSGELEPRLNQHDLDYRSALEQVLPDARPATAAEVATAHSAFAHAEPVATARELLHGEYTDASVTAEARQRASANHEWWHGLTAEQQRAVLRVHPHELGNADGVPFRFRDEANRLAIARDLAGFRARVPEGVELTHWMDKHLAPAERLELENLLYTHRALERAQRQADSVSDAPPVQVLSYGAKEFGGEGRAVVAFGDADLAEVTAWQIPGITTTLQRLSGRLSNSWNLYEVASALAPDKKLLSIAWLGYDAPSGGKMMTETVSPRPAIEGGRLLARDVWGLHTTRELQSRLPGGPPPPINRLFAHSFGSTTTAYAAAGDRFAPIRKQVEVILLGSPGMGPLSHASEFGAAKVYVAAGSRDPVTWLGSNTPGQLGRFAGRGQGVDPSTWRFGATRIASEFPDLPRFSDALRTHRQYWQYLDPALRTPTEALGNFARIAIGRGDAVDTVAHRPGVDVPTWLGRYVAGRPHDPEATRDASVEGDFSYRLPPEPAAPVPGAVGPEIQGHRGGRGLWSENTLPAFRKAMELGVDAIELDVGRTADGVPVVHHEQRIDQHSARDTAPVTPGDPQFPYVGKPIGELTFEQVRSIDTGVVHGKFAATQTTEPGSTIATLDEVAQLVVRTEWPGTLSVEIKTDPHWTDAQVRALVADTVDVLEARGVRYRLLGFDWRVLALGAELAPNADLVALVSPRTTTRDWLGTDAGVHRLDQVRSIAAQIRGIPHTPGGDLPAAARAAGADILSPEHTMVTEELMRQAERAGLRVVPWTVNRPADLGRMIDLGVTGIVTDFPDRLRALLAERGFALPGPGGAPGGAGRDGKR